jgi:hypothetical protein
VLIDNILLFFAAILILIVSNIEQLSYIQKVDSIKAGKPVFDLTIVS